MQEQNKPSFVLGVDLLGSDTPPHLLYQSVKEIPAPLYLFGPHGLPVDCPISDEDLITMEDNPLVAVRRKKNSSLAIAMRMLREGKLDAFISAGNTGALFASAKMHLPLLPGITRPALLALMPSKQGEIAVVDVGANISFQPEHLVEFARMGIAYQKSRGIAEPKVGLLNIGAEALKGTPDRRTAYQQLQQLSNFIGNVEGKDVFHGPVDVLVTDGFTGNIFLKTAEGIASVILESALAAHFPLRVKYHGALLCGLDGLVIKCHGSITPAAYRTSIEGTLSLLHSNFLSRLKSNL